MNCQELNDLEGLQFIPVLADKKPKVTGWQKTVKKYDLSNVENVGLVCGEPSGNLMAIDIDCKYDITGTLFHDYKKIVNEADQSILKKLVVQRTTSGGYHFIFRSEKLEGNKKVAQRNTTDAEKKYTYDENYNKQVIAGISHEDAHEFAQAKADNDKVRVLIETRGIGGQIVCYPSKGYEFVYGDFYSINTLTVDEKNILLNCAASFNSYLEEYKPPKHTPVKVKLNCISPFEDYDDRGDVVGLLVQHGWSVVKNKGAKTLMLRPGQTSSESSGNYDHDKKWFSVFSTSTEFNPQTAYRPYAVFAMLECKRDFSEASRRLYEMGYGEKPAPKEKEKQSSTRVIQSRINLDDDDLSFLATPSDYNGYLKQVVDGTLPQGLTTGIPSLDEYFLFKEGNFVNINGIDGVGKSVVLWYLLLLASMYHGWKGIIFSSENTLGGFMRKMMQYYWGKSMKPGHYQMTEMEMKIAQEYIEAHFKLIKAQEDLYNYKDILNMVKKTKKKYPDYKYALIDPYNSLKIDLSGFSKLSTHEYHYEALSELKSYGQQNNFGWFINHHAVTAAARAKDADGRYPIAPRKADTEGGQKVANKTDDFLTIHRVVQHPTENRVVEIHVRKIKDTETGGQATPLEMPVKLEMYKGQCGFIERLEMGGNPIDPIMAWHEKNGTKQSTLFHHSHSLNGNSARLPYKDDNEVPDIYF